MSGCCRPGELDDMFSPAMADRDARRYAKNGLGAESRRIVEVVRRLGTEPTVLEVGGGIGATELELVRAGASHATNVELSRSYEAVAAELIDAAGLAGRIDRRVADFVAEADSVPAADAVILERVVCCYPDADALVAAAARHAKRVLVLSFPIDRPPAGVVRALINVWPGLRGWKFRFYVHRTNTVIAAAEAQGMRLAERQKGLFWQMLVFERTAVAA
jgi:magnesium-protoporphyrin O-methyltransferase